MTKINKKKKIDLMIDIIECSSVQTGNFQKAIKAMKKMKIMKHLVPSKKEVSRIIKKWKNN